MRIGARVRNADLAHDPTFSKRFPATFFSTSLPGGFSALDKYLMGIYPANKVDDFFAIDASSSKIWKHFALPGNTAAGKKVRININDVKAALGGERVPDWRGSQKVFTAAFVLVVPKGQKADPNALGVVEYFRRRIPEKFRAETENVMTIDAALPPPAR